MKLHYTKWLTRCITTLLLLTVPVALGGKDDTRAARRTPVVKAVEKVRGAVVNISTERVVVRRQYDGFFGPGGDAFDRRFDDFFRSRRGRVIEKRRVKQPLGSGFIITSDGLVVTNEHVVRRASNIRLSLPNGETFDAELLAADPDEDLALLRVKTDKPLPAIPFGRSADLMLGETVIALGNPFGFENSVTAGIVSALDRKVTVGSGAEAVEYKELIQTSALINPGNSGGPLVNILGELVGINAAVVSHAQGIGLAISVDRARERLAALMATRKVAGAWSGIKAVTHDRQSGARVIEIAPKSPAAAVLKPADNITELNGKPVADLFGFALAVAQQKPGDILRLGITRNGKRKTVSLELAPVPEISAAKAFSARCGIEGKDLTPAVAKRLKMRVDKGVFITKIHTPGPAADSGLQVGDIIVQIGSLPVRNLRDAAEAVLDARASAQMVIVIVRGRYKAFTRITLSKSPPI